MQHVCQSDVPSFYIFPHLRKIFLLCHFVYTKCITMKNVRLATKFIKVTLTLILSTFWMKAH